MRGRCVALRGGFGGGGGGGGGGVCVDVFFFLFAAGWLIACLLAGLLAFTSFFLVLIPLFTHSHLLSTVAPMTASTQSLSNPQKSTVEPL